MVLLFVCFKMAVSNGVVTRARVLAFIHIVVGALLIIFGIVDAALIFYGAYIRFLVLPIVFGIWVSFPPL